MSKLQVGFARLDITPPLGTLVEGYFFERRMTGVLDPLYVNAVAVRDGEKTAVIMSCDLIALPSSAVKEWTPQIAAAAGVEEDAVFIACTHTHTGPVIAGGHANYESDPQYDAWFARRLRDAAVMAVNDCTDVEQMLAYEGDCKNTTFVRRFKMRGGYYQTWGERSDPNMLDWASPVDESLRLVRIIRTNAEEIVLVNFQGHPDCVSGTLISADYPGFLVRKVEARRPNTKCVFFDGAEGNLVMEDWRYESVPAKKYVAARVAGRKLADFVLEHMDEATELKGDGVVFGQEWVSCKTKFDPSRVPEAKRIIDIHENGDEEAEIGPDWIATPLIADAYKIVKLDAEQLEYMELRLSAVSFGGLAFLGITGEPFCELGKYIRDNAPYPVTFVCSETNGSGDYFPTAEAYEQGGYEPGGTHFPKGTGEQLAKGAVKLLKKLSKQ